MGVSALEDRLRCGTWNADLSFTQRVHVFVRLTAFIFNWLTITYLLISDSKTEERTPEVKFGFATASLCIILETVIMTLHFRKRIWGHPKGIAGLLTMAETFAIVMVGVSAIWTEKGEDNMVAVWLQMAVVGIYLFKGQYFSSLTMFAGAMVLQKNGTVQGHPQMGDLEGQGGPRQPEPVYHQQTEYGQPPEEPAPMYQQQPEYGQPMDEPPQEYQEPLGYEAPPQGPPQAY